MKKFKRLTIILITGLIMAFGFGVADFFSIPGAQQIIPSAEARIGRPLTPVSVAGVARRTVRRCAVGVYNCELSAPRSLDNLIGQI